MSEKVTHLPYKTQILRNGNFIVNEKTYSAADIVKQLEPLLTPARIERIAQVVNSRTFSVAAVIENLYDVGNISAVMRSTESFGFLPFHIIERPEARYKMSDRISRGTEKWLDIRKYIGPEKCFADLKNQGFKIYATDLAATHSIDEIDFTEKVAVVFGNEKEGISSYAREHVDGRFIIPMYGFAQSFNISVAASLCFYHIHSARRKKWGVSGDLTEEEKLNLKAHYYLRTAPDFLK